MRGGAGAAEGVEQEVGEQEVGQVVGREGHLDSVVALATACEEPHRRY